MMSTISKKVPRFITTSRHNAVVDVLKEEINRLRKQHLPHGTKRLYQDVIFNLTKENHSVIPGNDVDKQTIKILADSAIKSYNEQGIFSGRVNEFGNHMETHIKSAGDTKVIKPFTLHGKKQDTGYPDRFVETPAGKFYLEIKVFGKQQGASKQRTFYLCNANKITTSCPHYLLGFEHEEKTLTGHIHIIDMFNKNLKLKCEWATDNYELYQV